MTTIMEDLVAQGLGGVILSVDEVNGRVEWRTGIFVTGTQLRTCSDIILQHLQPTEYATMLAMRADAQTVINEYQNMINRMEQIVGTTSLPFTQQGFNQLVEAVKDLSLYLERNYKYHAYQVRSG